MNNSVGFRYTEISAESDNYSATINKVSGLFDELIELYTRSTSSDVFTGDASDSTEMKFKKIKGEYMPQINDLFDNFKKQLNSAHESYMRNEQNLTNNE